jgi:catechol 2,3-dioxygenase-like lactoylglutathione lyase family enzyme
MQALDHVSITVRSLERALPFYDAIFSVLQLPKVYERADAAGYGERNRSGEDGHTYLSLLQSAAAQPDPRRHWCFRAASASHVRAFYAAGLAAGGRDAGAPGLRLHYHPGYYAAFLEDPEGNRIEAVTHGGDDA